MPTESHEESRQQSYARNYVVDTCHHLHARVFSPALTFARYGRRKKGTWRCSRHRPKRMTRLRCARLGVAVFGQRGCRVELGLASLAEFKTKLATSVSTRLHTSVPPR